jgi:hypothetical protein
MKSNRQLEHEMQCAFVNLADTYLEHTGYVGYANPNQGTTGGNRGSQKQRQAVIMGHRMKREGKKAGIPDWFLAWPRLGFHGLYVEFKLDKNELLGIKKKTFLSEAQKEMVDALRNAGYCVAVCRDAEDAFELLKRYTLGADKCAVMQEHHWK